MESYPGWGFRPETSHASSEWTCFDPFPDEVLEDFAYDHFHVACACCYNADVHVHTTLGADDSLVALASYDSVGIRLTALPGNYFRDNDRYSVELDFDVRRSHFDRVRRWDSGC